MDNENKPRWWWWWVGLLVVFIVFVWAYWPTLVFNEVTRQRETSEGQKLVYAGQFGDMYGALTSLLTALGTVGVLVSVLLLRAQVAEARKTTQAAREATTAAQESAKLAREAFQAEHQARNLEESRRYTEASEERQHRKAERVDRQFFQLLPIILGHVEKLDRNPFFGFPALQHLANSALRNADGASNYGTTAQEAWIEVCRRVQSEVSKHSNEMLPFLSALERLVAISARKELTNSRELCDLIVAIMGSDVVAFACLYSATTVKTDGPLSPWSQFVTISNFLPTNGTKIWSMFVTKRFG